MWGHPRPCIPKGQVNAADEYSPLNLEICEAKEPLFYLYPAPDALLQ